MMRENVAEAPMHSAMVTLESKKATVFRGGGQMRRRFSHVDLIFFDPDNGFEITSKPMGRKEEN
jgi:hypothetical protein